MGLATVYVNILDCCSNTTTYWEPWSASQLKFIMQINLLCHFLLTTYSSTKVKTINIYWSCLYFHFSMCTPQQNQKMQHHLQTFFTALTRENDYIHLFCSFCTLESIQKLLIMAWHYIFECHHCHCPLKSFLETWLRKTLFHFKK